MTRSTQRGAALLLAMMIVGLVATLAAGMIWQQKRAVQIEAAERARSQAAWILVGALDWARLILREDARSSRGPNAHDSLDEPWATPLAEARLSTFLAADPNNNTDSGPEAFLSGEIVDAQSRFNLRGLVDGTGKPNDAQILALQSLADIAGAPSDTARRIADGLSAASDPARAAAPLRPARIDDLVWLGIDQATIERLRPYVDLLPVATPVNANTASREVLAAAIGIDLGTAERLVQLRSREAFGSLADLVKALPLASQEAVNKGNVVSVGSSFFEVTGRLRLESRVLEEVSLLHRDNQNVVVVRSERRSLATPAGA